MGFSTKKISTKKSTKFDEKIGVTGTWPVSIPFPGTADKMFPSLRKKIIALILHVRYWSCYEILSAL